jgi:hypothetical protein
MEAEISTEHQIVRKEVALVLDYAVTHYQESRHCSGVDTSTSSAKLRTQGCE